MLQILACSRYARLFLEGYVQLLMFRPEPWALDRFDPFETGLVM